MKKYIQKLLYTLAQGVLRRHKPDVIAITGSVGKTSTKEAVYAVLAAHFDVRQTLGNYNNELGVPLTILGCRSGGRNPFRWTWILCKGVLYSILPLPYPDMLVLEMGADKPSDIKYLVELAAPRVGIVTTIGDEPSHIEFFKDVDQLAREKLRIMRKLTADGWAIINRDDVYCRAAENELKAQVLSISTKLAADIQAVEIEYAHDPRQLTVQSSGEGGAKTPNGLRFKFRRDGNVVPCFLPGALGEPAVYAALFAAAVGTVYGLNLVQISEALRSYTQPPGRMNVIAGVHDSVIIDDSYNASPSAVRSALDVLEQLDCSGRRIVCLGNMEELGQQSKRIHRSIGKRIAEGKFDSVYTVGDKAAWLAEAVLESAALNTSDSNTGMIHVKQFSDPETLANMLKDHLQPGDVVLVKGSQAARMEKITRALLAHPEQANRVLVRQYGKWR